MGADATVVTVGSRTLLAHRGVAYSLPVRVWPWLLRSERGAWSESRKCEQAAHAHTAGLKLMVYAGYEALSYSHEV